MNQDKIPLSIIDPQIFDSVGQFYFQHNWIQERILKAEEEFYLKLATECLGRPPDLEQDPGRFQILEYHHLNKTMFAFDGIEVGEIKKDYINLKWEFIPINPK